MKFPKSVIYPFLYINQFLLIFIDPATQYYINSFRSNFFKEFRIVSEAVDNESNRGPMFVLMHDNSDQALRLWK